VEWSEKKERTKQEREEINWWKGRTKQRKETMKATKERRMKDCKKRKTEQKRGGRRESSCRSALSCLVLELQRDVAWQTDRQTRLDVRHCQSLTNSSKKQKKCRSLSQSVPNSGRCSVKYNQDVSPYSKFVEMCAMQRFAHTAAFIKQRNRLFSG
jgi:hypothetical protein